MAFLSYMVYVLMCSWLTNERCTYPKLDIAISINYRCVRLVKSYLISTSFASLHMHKSIMSMPQPADRSLAESLISISTLSALPLNSLTELPLLSTSRPVADEATINVTYVDFGIPSGCHERPYRPRRTWLRLQYLYRALLHTNFFPAATTLCLNTGLPILLSVLENGFMMAFSQSS